MHKDKIRDNDAKNAIVDDSEGSDDRESDTFSLDEEEMMNHIMSAKMSEFQQQFGLSAERKDDEQDDEASNEDGDSSSQDESTTPGRSKKRAAVTTVFEDPTRKYDRSATLDVASSKSSNIALTLKEHKNLKRKRTEEMQQELQERKKKRKAKFKAETYLKDQDEHAIQMRKYYFEMKSMLLKDSMTEDEYNRFLKAEAEKQGVQYTGPQIKSANKNYRELKDERREQRQMMKEQKQVALGMGHLSKKDLKDERRQQMIKKQKEIISFNTRFGAPGSVGKEDKRMFRTKALGGGVGTYRKGMLILSDREIKSVTRKANGGGKRR